MDRHEYRQALSEIRKGLRFAGAASYNAANDYREGAPHEAIARRLSDVERGVTDAIREVDDAIARDERDRAWRLRAEEAEKKLRAAERERDEAQAALAAERARVERVREVLRSKHDRFLREEAYAALGDEPCEHDYRCGRRGGPCRVHETPRTTPDAPAQAPRGCALDESCDREAGHAPPCMSRDDFAEVAATMLVHGDTPAQAPAAVDASAVSHAVQEDKPKRDVTVRRHAYPVSAQAPLDQGAEHMGAVEFPGGEARKLDPPVTLDDLAALRRDAVRDALLAVAEAAEVANTGHGSATAYTIASVLRARAGQ